jgi:hypothetical protein
MLRGIAVIQLVRSRPIYALQAAARPKQTFLENAEPSKQGTNVTADNAKDGEGEDTRKK